MTFEPVWFSLFPPIMKAEDDGEGACRQQLFAELVVVLKHKHKTQNDILRRNPFALIEKDLFVKYAVDTVRGCNHPIIANL